ncbi:MAG: type II toxin-antitoxin system VapB family antitoxin [Deltaproteobacteria bacterium]|nr:type II toxin-antitoxin system VapB family antitoxin [Deltaproteobacteria bacterium]
MLRCMRTNIELNDDLLAEARKYSRAKNKRAIVEEALRVYVAVKAEAQRRLTYKERLNRLRDKTRSVRLASDTRDILRQDRDSR